MIKPINDAGWGRLYQQSKEGDAIGFITAFRGDLSLAENRRRNQQLEAMVRALHFGFDMIEGHYVEDKNGAVTEETLVICSPAERKGELKKLLDEAMRAYDQDSYIYIATLESANGTESKSELICRDGKAKDLGELELTQTGLGSVYSEIKHKAFRFGDIVEGCQYRNKSLGQGDCYCYLQSRKWLRESDGDFCRTYLSKFGYSSQDLSLLVR